jgi:hypothetical protein
MWTYEFILVNNEVKPVMNVILNIKKIGYMVEHEYTYHESYYSLEFKNDTDEILFEVGKSCKLFNIDEVINEITHSNLNDVYHVITVNYSIYIKKLID